MRVPLSDTGEVTATIVLAIELAFMLGAKLLEGYMGKAVTWRAER